jgi:hypothetical protein
MKQLRFAALGLLAFAASCASIAPTPGGGVSTPSGAASIPSTPLALGDYRAESAGAVLGGFERTVASRYGEGMTLSAVTADLRRNEFNCAATTATDRGDPPAQVCRRTIAQSGCTHTWQVHLFDADNNARLARTRALYDRRCGNDGLLGGPG